MRKLKIQLKNERGYFLINVIFLTLIASLSGMILINAAMRARNPQPTLRLTAFYLANEYFAYVESRAANGVFDISSPFKDEDYLTSYNASRTTNFTIEPKIIRNSNPYEVMVTVNWTVDGQEDKLELKRTIWVVQR